MRYLARKLSLTKLLSVLAVLVLIGSGLLSFRTASGAQLPQRYLQLSDELPGVTATYTLGLTIATAGSLGSIEFQFCSNNPIPNQTCTVPVGFDISAATLTAQTGETGFSISSATTANDLILTRPVTAAAAVASTYTLDGVVNPSNPGTYYVRVYTYATTDASGAYTDHGGIAFPINVAVNLSTYVPPYITMCTGIVITGYDCSTATGDYINFGIFSPGKTSSASTQINVATNAGNGYALSVNGSTLTSGNDIIPAMATDDVSRPGVAQFGINLRQNTNPSVGQNVSGPGIGTVAPPYNSANLFRFVPGDVIASANGAADFNKYSVSYVVNVPSTQPAGIYVTTLTYSVLGSF